MRIRQLLRFGVVLALVLAPLGARAQFLPPPYTLGKQYQVIPDAQPPKQGQPVVVQEFFWYGCPHCFRLDPLITAWAKKLPKGVVFRRVPDNLGRQLGVVHQQAFYIARELGILKQTHAALFDAIHVENRPMATLGAIRDFYVGIAGISAKQFNDASSSIAVQADIKQANALAMKDQIRSVPTLVIGGYYKTNGMMAAANDPEESEMTSYGKMLKIASWLADKLRKGQRQ